MKHPYKKCLSEGCYVPSSATIGVVTVTYNSGRVIPDFIESLRKQTYRNFRLYAIDNASSDNSLELLENYSDARYAIIRNRTNVGVAEGNNIGIRAALNDGCGSVLLINNDTAFGADLISGLHEGLQKYHCDMIVPKILYLDPPDKIWSAGGAFSLIRGRPRHLGFNRKDDGSFDKACEVEYSPTCCMLIRREVFERIGLMDSNYFVYFDDADFCLRAHRAGVRLVYAPDTSLFHKVSSLIGHRSDLSIRYVSRNHVYFVLKHFRLLQNAYYLPICQAHILVRCWSATNRAKAFVIAQKAFWEGISVFRSTRTCTEAPLLRHAQVRNVSQSVTSFSDDANADKEASHPISAAENVRS
jgi:GT2 family glycosyltransferase